MMNTELERFERRLEEGRHRLNPDLADRVFGNYREYRNRNKMPNVKTFARVLFEPGATFKAYLDTRSKDLGESIVDCSFSIFAETLKIGSYAFLGKIIYSSLS